MHVINIVTTPHCMSSVLPSKQKDLYGTIETRGLFAVFLLLCIYLIHTEV